MAACRKTACVVFVVHTDTHHTVECSGSIYVLGNVLVSQICTVSNYSD